MKAIILGGYGRVGRVAAKQLLEHLDDVEVAIAGRSLEKAEAFCSSLGRKAKPLQVDAGNADQLSAAVRGYDIALNSTSVRYNVPVAEVAINERISLIDLGFIPEDTLRQLKMHEKAKEKQMAIIPGCGVTPGLTNMLARCAANFLDSVESIHIRWASITPADYANLQETSILPAGQFSTVTVYEKGRFVEKEPFSDGELVRFPGFGKYEQLMCYSVPHSESVTLPLNITITDECNVKISRHPKLMEAARKAYGLGAGSQGLQFSETDDADFNGFALSVAVTGYRKQGRIGGRFRLTYHSSMTGGSGHNPVDLYTGIPAAVAMEFVYKGISSQKGVVPPEAYFPAERFMETVAHRYTQNGSAIISMLTAAD